MTSPTDLPTIDQPEFDDQAVGRVQRFMEGLDVQLSALEASELLQQLQPHIVQSLVAEFAEVQPTPYEVRRDALGLAVRRAAGTGVSLTAEADFSLAMAPIFESLLAECVDKGTAPAHLGGSRDEDDEPEPAGD